MAKTKKSERKKKIKNKFLYYTPRILVIVLALFFSIFSFDVFEEYSFPEVIFALFMSLVPSIILVILLVVSWRYERVGGIFIFILGLFSIEFFDTLENPYSFFFISLPVILTGILFLLSYKYNS